MAQKILKAFALLVVLSLPASGQEKIMVCKNIENAFTEADCGRVGSQVSRVQGPPGKAGPRGFQGRPGVPGIQGIPGTPATVDYARRKEMVDEKIRQGLEEVNSKVNSLQSDLTESIERPKQRCNEERGLPYDGKCYIIPYLSSSWNLNYATAVQKCSSQGALLAEIHSPAHQQAIQDFFSSRVTPVRFYIHLWTGMTYDRSEQKLIYRSGKKVLANQFKWSDGYPKANESHDKMTILIINNENHGFRGLRNEAARVTWHGVLCEKPL